MKKVIRCLSCNKVVREFGGHSYRVELEERVKNMLTGEINIQTLNGRICRDCSIEAGYKVVREK